MKTYSGIKVFAIIVSIILLIPISINWFDFLKRNFSDDVVDASDNKHMDFQILTDSTVEVKVNKYWRYNIEIVAIPNKVRIKRKEYFVTSIGAEAFNDCYKLTNITIPESVESIEEWAFYYCSSLTNIVIPKSVTNIEYSAFIGCLNLDVVIDNYKDSVVFEDAFRGCNSVRYTK